MFHPLRSTRQQAAQQHLCPPTPNRCRRPQASDVLRQMLDPASKPGAALRKALPGGRPPALPDLFSIGQYVRTTIIGLGSSGDDDKKGE